MTTSQSRPSSASSWPSRSPSRVSTPGVGCCLALAAVEERHRVAACQRLAHEVRADEAGAAEDQDAQLALARRTRRRCSAREGRGNRECSRRQQEFAPVHDLLPLSIHQSAPTIRGSGSSRTPNRSSTDRATRRASASNSRAARAAVVHQHQRVLRGDAGVAVAMAAPAAALDQPRGRELAQTRARRIARAGRRVLRAQRAATSAASRPDS